MVSVESGITVSSVNVMTSDEGGLSTEQIAELALDKILRVSNNAPPAIRDQAEAFKEDIRRVLLFYLDLSKREERATMSQKLSKSGNTDLANLVRRL